MVMIQKMKNYCKLNVENIFSDIFYYRMSTSYQLPSYLLNSYPRLLTNYALKLYVSGYEPVSKKINEDNKINGYKKLTKIKTIYTLGALFSAIKKNGNNTNAIKNKFVYKTVIEIVEDELLVLFSHDTKLSAISKLMLHLKNISDPIYDNKFEYLRVKLAEQ
jgi:hypothetical protein